MTIFAPIQTIGDTIHRRICPLYSVDERNRVRMLGSAVPFAAGGITFLITATHVCLEKHRQAVPLFTWGSEGPVALVGTRLAWDYRQGSDPDLDIALMSEPADVGQIKAKTPGVHYMITGYPHARNRIRPPDFSLPALATYLVTGDIRSTTELGLRDKSDADHFAIYYKLGEVATPSGAIFRTPRPQGMSGGGVWQLDIDVRTGLASTPLLVGIVIEYHVRSSVFVASRIQRAAPLAHDLVSLLSGIQPPDVVAGRSSK
jgi:hypothetical protein